MEFQIVLFDGQNVKEDGGRSEMGAQTHDKDEILIIIRLKFFDSKIKILLPIVASFRK